jgi:2-oxoglutarate ferredoxin oxidoreductase subunit alpha
VLTDQYLADSQWTYDELNLGRLVYTDWRTTEAELEKLTEYKRHFLTEYGISPFARPGASHHVVVTDSDEHDEEGHLVEDAAMRIQMVEKRLFRKMPLIRSEISPPVFYGESRPDVILVGWGSTYGIMREAVKALSETVKIAMLHFSEIFPFPSNQSFDYMEILEKAKMTLCIEQNASGQFARLMKTETGFNFTGKINRYDGRPFLVEELLGEISGYLG